MYCLRNLMSATPPQEVVAINLDPSPSPPPLRYFHACLHHPLPTLFGLSLGHAHSDDLYAACVACAELGVIPAPSPFPVAV